MPYVKRDSSGQITMVSDQAQVDTSEEISSDSPELRAFVEQLTKSSSDVFETSDMKLIRVIEDVIDLLIAKNVICITELPQPVQAKLMERRSLRHSLNSLSLFGDEDDQTI